MRAVRPPRRCAAAARAWRVIRQLSSACRPRGKERFHLSLEAPVDESWRDTSTRPDAAIRFGNAEPRRHGLLSERLSQTLLEPRPKSPSDADFGAAAEDRDVVAVRILPQLAHEIDVDDGGAMDAD